MRAVYLTVKYITIVGTFLQGFFEHLSCRMYDVLIEDGRYLRSNEMCGHIEHELIKKRGTAFGVCFFPFLFNLLIGLILTAAGSVNIFYLGEIFYERRFKSTEFPELLISVGRYFMPYQSVPADRRRSYPQRADLRQGQVKSLCENNRRADIRRAVCRLISAERRAYACHVCGILAVYAVDSRHVYTSALQCHSRLIGITVYIMLNGKCFYTSRFCCIKILIKW